MPTSLDTGSAIHAAAQSLAAAITAGETISRTSMNAAMNSAFDGTNADGAWTQRDSFEALETAVAKSLASIIPDGTARQQIEWLQAFEKTLPTHTVRSEQQIRRQQFSTPPSIARLCAHLAAPTKEDDLLEPSAGTGILASCCAETPRSLRLNEIDPTRASLLAHLFPGSPITSFDAAKLSSLLPANYRPSLIVMNPPFSVSAIGTDDKSTAARHLRSAIQVLLPGGRLVAIMPDNFSPTSANSLFEASTEGANLVASLRLDEGAYAKHGTGIAVRILVFDKTPKTSAPATINRASAAELIASIDKVPPRLPITRPAAPARNAAPGIFRSLKSPKTRPIIVRQPEKNDVLPVEYTVLDNPAALGEQHGIYTAYRPSRIEIAKSGQHPTQLVESAAMGSIEAPKPSYKPSLPQQTVERLLLSEAQLETVIYAGEAWSRDLPGKFTHDPASLSLTPSADGATYRTGFFLGDGTGAGKGRQNAACILDQWTRGSRRHIWVSKNQPLFEDAQRDWTALGGLPSDIIEISKWKIDQSILAPEGILFLPYATLRSARSDASRLDQIVEWAGPNFEGVIIFDESHEMGGVAGGENSLMKTEGSLQGIAGVQLQNRLPRARVLYASATGASEINNLAYAVRLGLWGPGTAFADREQFITRIREGGIAAMELVARDLKATGLYIARALSFTGVEYDILQHELTPSQIAIYDQYADAWSIIHQNLEDALEITGIVDPIENKTLNSMAKAAARSRFESCKQRFFGQVLLSFKLETLIPQIDRHLKQDESVVVQIVTTGEAILDRRLKQLEPEEFAQLDIDLSPRESIVDYLIRAFPTCQMQEFADDQGNVMSRPMFDPEGRPIHNQAAIEIRDALVEQICAMPTIETALDALITHYGTEHLAEVTGRSKRLVKHADGSQRLEPRSARTNLAETAAFMHGDKRILAFSDAGGTGRSYHASLDHRNQQTRIHFLLELGWRADKAIQGIGRTHRTHQAQPPVFRPVTTNCKGESRFTSTIARRLDTLGALTRGQRQTGGQGIFDAADNLESIYAKHALHDWYVLLASGKLKSTTLKDFERTTGLSITDQDGILSEDLPPIQRWLNRLLAMRIATQDSIFEEFMALVETRVDAAKTAGKYDIGVETILVESAEILSDTIVRTDPVTQATTHILEMILKRRRQIKDYAYLEQIMLFEQDRVFLYNEKSGKPALSVPTWSHMDDEGRRIRRRQLVRPSRNQSINEDELAETAWKEIAEPRFRKLWENECDLLRDELVSDTVFVATGLLLPVWEALPKTSLDVIRIVDAEGTSWLGRQIPETDVEATLKHLGASRTSQTDLTKIVPAILGGATYTAPHPVNLTFKTSRVNHQHRIEITGAAPAQLPALKASGAFTEIIAYKTRVFIPLETAATIIPKIIKPGGEGG